MYILVLGIFRGTFADPYKAKQWAVEALKEDKGTCKTAIASFKNIWWTFIKKDGIVRLSKVEDYR